MPFGIIRNDITKVSADAIVNTANPKVAIGGGVDSAIYNSAGKEQLLEARSKIGVLKVGEVGVTDAFNLDAKYIIHVSGPRFVDGNHDEEKLLRSCYDKALKRAKELGCNSIAFPLLATGSYGFPKDIGIQIAVNAFTDFLIDNDMSITLVVFGDKEVNISGQLVEDVRSYIDDEYVEEALDNEYSNDRGYSAHLMEARVGSARESVGPLESAALTDEGSDNLDDILENIYTDSFAKHLQQLINKKGYKNSEVYATANISKQYFSKLLKGQVNPSKEKMLALAIGLRLNLDETIDFLQIAGYALSPISQTDAIVTYFIEKKDYNVIKIDIVLFDYGLEPLSNI